MSLGRNFNEVIMPATHAICPDGKKIDIDTCLSWRGCRMANRCAPMPYLRAALYDREWRGVSPSSSSSDARLLWLKATTDYAVRPSDRAFSLLGTAVHGALSLHSYNVLSEESLSDEQMKGMADLLERDEYGDGYILTDHKTFGSYKVGKSIGMVKEKEVLLDETGKPILLKSGANKGKPKTKNIYVVDPTQIDREAETLQVNRYRIFYENAGFPIKKMQLFVIVRDGGLMMAQQRGITESIYTIPIERLPDQDVMDFYAALIAKVGRAIVNNYVEKCDKKFTWDGIRCERFCEVAETCNRIGE